MLREYINLPRPVHILCLGMFINRAGSFVLVFLTIYISEKLGHGEAFAAQCMGVFGFGSIFASLIGGQLADQIGRKTVMVSALFGGAILLGLLSTASSKPAIALTILGYALIAETFRPACSAMLGDFTTPAQRPIAFGLFYISINLGFACGPPIGGILADISYRLLFFGDAATMAVFGVIILLMLPESKSLLTDENDNRPVEIPAAKAIRQILADGPFLVFCVATLLIAVVFMQSVSTLPLHIKRAGYDNSQFGALMAINGLLIFIVQLPLTHYLERFNAMSNIIVGGVLIAVGFGLYFFPVSLIGLIAAVLVWTLGEIMQAPFKQTVVTNLAPLPLRARYLGLFSMCYSLALTIGAPTGGFVLERFGARALWRGCFVVAAFGVVAYAMAYRSITLRTNQTAPEPMDEPTAATASNCP
ncbi:MAG: MDR family MFS transporter [Planctomycetaceae bacterium]